MPPPPPPRVSTNPAAAEFVLEEGVVAKDAGVTGVLGVLGKSEGEGEGTAWWAAVDHRLARPLSNSKASEGLLGTARVLLRCGCLPSCFSELERTSDLMVEKLGPQATNSGEMGLQGGDGRLDTGLPADSIKLVILIWYGSW